MMITLSFLIIVLLTVLIIKSIKLANVQASNIELKNKNDYHISAERSYFKELSELRTNCLTYRKIIENTLVFLKSFPEHLHNEVFLSLIRNIELCLSQNSSDFSDINIDNDNEQQNDDRDEDLSIKFRKEFYSIVSEYSIINYYFNYNTLAVKFVHNISQKEFIFSINFEDMLPKNIKEFAFKFRDTDDVKVFDVLNNYLEFEYDSDEDEDIKELAVTFIKELFASHIIKFELGPSRKEIEELLVTKKDNQ